MNPAYVAGWWWMWIRQSARDGWEWLPGPWPVKLLLAVLFVAAQAFPGPLDDLLFIALVAGVKRLIGWWRRR